MTAQQKDPGGRVGRVGRVGRLERFASAHGGAILIALMAIDVALTLAIAAHKYRFFLYDDIDLAIFTQATAGILRGSMFSSIRGMAWLGDHSSLVLFLIAPIFAIARHPMTLVVVQTLALAAGAWPLHALAKRELPGALAPLGCALLYLLHPALGYVRLFEFHPETLAAPLLIAAFLFVRSARRGPALGAAGLALLCREDVALVVGAMGLYALVLSRGRARAAGRGRAPVRATAAAGAGAPGRAAARTDGPAGWVRPTPALGFGLIGLAVASLVLSFAVLQPALRAGEADYGAMYEQWGATTGEALAGMARQPLRVIEALFSTPGNPLDSKLKPELWLHLLLPLAFLPLLAPLELAIALPVLAEHLLSWRTQQHTILYQYTALVAPILIAAAVVGLSRLVRRLGGGAAAATRWVALALLATLVSQLMFGPLVGRGIAQSMKPILRTWADGQDRAFSAHRERMLAALPREGAVAGTLEMLARLATRPEVHSLHHVFTGRYTFSSRPYPMPANLAAVIGDVAHHRMVIYPASGTGARLREMLAASGLGLADAAGDLLLWARAPAALDLLAEAQGPPPRARGIVFDAMLEFVGHDALDATGEPGGWVEFRTWWRRLGEIDRLHLAQLVLLDAQGRQALVHPRYLGYVVEPPPDWAPGVVMEERYRLVLPTDLAPGAYRLTLRMAYRGPRASGFSASNDPQIDPRTGAVELGVIRVAGRARP